MIVRNGGSVVINGGQINGWLDASGAKDVQLFGAKVLGSPRSPARPATRRSRTTCSRRAALTGNAASSFGVALAATRSTSGLSCSDGVFSDYGADEPRRRSEDRHLLGPDRRTAAGRDPGDRSVGGTVPATLSLTLGVPAYVRRVHAGRRQGVLGADEATVISTAGDATLSVADPSSFGTGHLVNGTFILPQPLQGLGASRPGRRRSPTTPSRSCSSSRSRRPIRSARAPTPRRSPSR